MIKYIPDILKEINNNPELLISVYKDNYVVRTLLRYAFDKNLKMDLPEGIPPFKPDPAPIGMSPSTLYNQVKKLYIFTRKDLPNLRKEQLFIQLLESIHPKEAEIIIHVKDQSLNLKYPNITPELVVRAGIVTRENLISFQSKSEQKEKSSIQFTSPQINEQKESMLEKSLDHKFNDTAIPSESFKESTEQKVSEENPRNVKKKGRPKKLINY